MEKQTEELEALGYNEQLRRGYSTLELFSMSFSIMAIAPSVSSVLIYSVPAGAVGIVWGWFAACVLIGILGVSVAEFGSAMPTSGGFFYWTYALAPSNMRRFLSYIDGYADCFGLIAGASSITYGATTQLLAAVSMGVNFEATKYVTYGVYAALFVLQFVVCLLPSHWMSKVQLASLVTNVGMFIVVLIALPVGHWKNGHAFNSGEYAFGDMTNASDWEYGWVYILAWMAPLWSVSNFDSGIHLSEEAARPKTGVPIAVLGSILASAAGGFVICILLAFTMSHDMNYLLASTYGSPMAQILADSLGLKWATGLMSIFSAMQWWMGLGCMLGGTRQTWAFARDGGLPFSSFFSKVFGPGIPVYAVTFNTVISLLIGLLILVNSVAAQALFSMAITALYLSWILPIICRAVWFDRSSFVPGPFYTGHTISRALCIFTSVYGVFVVCVVTLLPQSKHTTPDTMNYSCVVTGAVLIFATVYYFAFGNRYYKGPQYAVVDYSDVRSSVSQDSKNEQGIEVVAGDDNKV